MWRAEQLYLTVAHFNYHRRPGYWINLRLMPNTAYRLQLSFMYGWLYMDWSLKQSQIQYQHQKTQDKDYYNEHKHCAMQPFETAFWGYKESQTFDWGAATPWSLLEPPPSRLVPSLSCSASASVDVDTQLRHCLVASFGNSMLRSQPLSCTHLPHTCWLFVLTAWVQFRIRRYWLNSFKLAELQDFADQL